VTENAPEGQLNQAEAQTEAPAEEIAPFNEGEREIAYRSESAGVRTADQASRPAVITAAAATGRRKEAIARVRIVPGSGNWTINGRTLDEYFPNKVHQQIVSEPFTTAAVEGAYDVIARINGGGISGPCAQRGRRRGQPSEPEEGRDADPRRPDQGAQEGRSEEGPQGSAVQQALSNPFAGLRHLRPNRS
jgi:small subunit ribosomal protein S9